MKLALIRKAAVSRSLTLVWFLITQNQRHGVLMSKYKGFPIHYPSGYPALGQWGGGEPTVKTASFLRVR